LAFLDQMIVRFTASFTRVDSQKKDSLDNAKIVIVQLFMLTPRKSQI